jgi:Flp pilus assembly protein TadG
MFTNKMRDERGQSMVEFAIIAPVILMVLFGIIQFAIVFNHHLTLTDAVRAGARQGAVSRLPDPAAAAGAAEMRVRSAASASLDSTAGGPLTVDVTFTDIGGGSAVEQGGDITVRATYPYEIDIFGIPIMTGTLNSETTERVE